MSLIYYCQSPRVQIEIANNIKNKCNFLRASKNTLKVPHLKYRTVSVGLVLAHFEYVISQIGSGLWFFFEPPLEPPNDLVCPCLPSVSLIVESVLTANKIDKISKGGLRLTLTLKILTTAVKIN